MLLSIAALAAAVQAAATAPVDFARVALSPGSWRYGPAPSGSAASFVDATGTARLVVTCNRATRLVSISRVSTTAAPVMQLWSSEGTRSITARFEPAVFRVTVDLAASDGMLDALAFSRGRIGVGMVGAAPLVVPAWAEPARAIEDCRS